MRIQTPRAVAFIGAGLILSFQLSSGAIAGATTTSTVTLSPGENIQTAVNAAPAYTAFVLTAGVYRNQTVSPKTGDTFSGQGYVVMNGSEVLSFQRDPAGSGLWVANAVADNSWVGVCETQNPLCGYNQDLFVDSVLQHVKQTSIDIGANEWFFDRVNNKVYMSKNPGGHVIELGKTNYAFTGPASNIEIDHITVEKYATPALQGAIGGYAWGLGSNWIVNVVESRLNHGGGITLGTKSQINNSFIHNNGQIGIKFWYGGSCVAFNNEISWNNTDYFSQTYESGGTKFWATSNLIVKYNYVHDNYGKGLWTDTDNIDTLYEYNTVTNNLGAGIQHEVSYSVIVRNNIVKGNNYVPASWVGAGQIRIMSSPNADVHDNTVEVSAAGGNGISVVNITRGTGAYGPWVAANNYVHNNTITYLGTNGKSGFENDTAGNTAGVNNRFDYNTYIMANCAEDRWVWQTNTPITWQALHAAGAETHGTYTIAAPVSGAPAPTASLSSSTLTFSNSKVGTTAAFKSITISNNGSAPLVVCSITPTGTNASSFSVPSGHQNCGTVDVGSNCSFDVAFDPTAAGKLISSLKIGSSAPASPQTVTLTGTGVAP